MRIEGAIRQNEILDNNAAELAAETTRGEVDLTRLSTDQSWVSDAIVDQYVALLRTMAPASFQIENCASWQKINGQQLVRTELAKRWGNGQRFAGKDTIVWTMYGQSHFAVCIIRIQAREIEILDSIKDTKWDTGKLKEFLHAVFGEPFIDSSVVQKSRQQVNHNDCGVYAMANARSIVEERDVQDKRMSGSHQKDSARKRQVREIRKLFASELREGTLKEWN